MKRLFYLVDAIDNVESISDDLHRDGVSNWRFHVVSKDEAGLYSHHIHTASVLDRTDLPRFVERGLIIGGLFALFFILPLSLWGDLAWPHLGVCRHGRICGAGRWLARRVWWHWHGKLPDPEVPP